MTRGDDGGCAKMMMITKMILTPLTTDYNINPQQQKCFHHRLLQECESLLTLSHEPSTNIGEKSWPGCVFK